MDFCSRCAAPLETQKLNDLPRRVCPACGYIYWNNPLPVAGAAVIDEQGCILLARRSIEPRVGMWNLPAGFMEWGESAERAARREVREETGIEIEITGFLTSAGGGRPTDQWISWTFVFFYARMTGGHLVADDDADRVEFFAPDALPENIAFRSNQKALRQWQEDREAGVWQALGMTD